MKNKKLLNEIDSFYHLATSAPIRKLAEADEFDRAAELIKSKQPKVMCRNGHNIKSELPSAPTSVSQFMVVSTKADKPDSFGIIPDDALVFIFLDEEHYSYPEQYPNDNVKVEIAKNYARAAGISVDDVKYFASKIGKSKVRDKKDASNRAYSHCVAVFKKE